MVGRFYTVSLSPSLLILPAQKFVVRSAATVGRKMPRLDSGRGHKIPAPHADPAGYGPQRARPGPRPVFSSQGLTARFFAGCANKRGNASQSSRV